MIVFDILCAAGHRFEGWFASAADYEAQKERRILLCPVCNCEEVDRIPSATRINIGAAPSAAPKEPSVQPSIPSTPSPDVLAMAQRLYSRMLDELLTKTEDLGAKFPEEARKIHYNEAPARPIRGVATQAEHDALVDEGIPVARIPVPSRERMN